LQDLQEEEGRRKKEEGRRKKEEGREKKIINNCQQHHEKS